MPAETVPALQAVAAAEQARLAAIQSALAARMLAERAAPTNGTGSRLLDIKTAAERTGMSKDWLYRHAKTLPFTRRLGRALKFDAAGLDRWLSTRPK